MENTSEKENIQSQKNLSDMSMFSEAPVLRIVKKAGALRISKNARNFIMNELKKFSFSIAKESVAQAELKGEEKVTDLAVIGAASRLYSNSYANSNTPSDRKELLEKENKLEVSIAPFHRLLKKSGAERISQNARIILANYVQAHAREVAKEATRLRAHSGFTLKRIDILEAEKNLKDRKFLFYSTNRTNLLKLDSGAFVSIDKFILPKDEKIEDKIPIENVVIEESKLEIHIKPIQELPPSQKCEFSVTLSRENLGCIESINYGSTKEGIIHITCPNFQARDINEFLPDEVKFSLQVTSNIGNASFDMLVIPKGYSKEALLKIFQIALKKEFGGIEKEFGNLKLDEKDKKEIISKMHQLAKEYDSLIAYECARRELARLAKISS
ncbi:MAG: NFYB/HAP3 family transcription factor subunit [Thermoplasmata archaeon]